MAEEGTYQVARTPGCDVIKGIEGCPDWFSIPVDGPDYLIGTQVSISGDGGEPASSHGFAPTGEESKVISRKHVAFKDKGGVTYVSDQGSTNGTELNGERLPPGDEVALHNNDEIYLAVRMIGLKFKDFVVQEQETAPVGRPGPEKMETSTGLDVDVAKHEVYIGGKTVEPRIQMHEFELLSSLYEAGGAVVRMDKLSQAVWPERWDMVPEKREFGQVVEEEYWFPKPGNDTNNGDIHQLVKRLRTKLAKYSEVEHIENVRGYGYKLV